MIKYNSNMHNLTVYTGTWHVGSSSSGMIIHSVHQEYWKHQGYNNTSQNSMHATHTKIHVHVQGTLTAVQMSAISEH